MYYQITFRLMQNLEDSSLSFYKYDEREEVSLDVHPHGDAAFFLKGIITILKVFHILL